MINKKTTEKQANPETNMDSTPMKEVSNSNIYFRLTNDGDLEITDTNTTFVIMRNQFQILYGMLISNQQMYRYPSEQLPFGPAFSVMPLGRYSPFGGNDR
jgi:hypothetical protein